MTQLFFQIPVRSDSGLGGANVEPYSGNVLEMVANLTWEDNDIIGTVGLLHPSTVILRAFQLPIVSLIHYVQTVHSPMWSILRHAVHCSSTLCSHF